VESNNIGFMLATIVALVTSTLTLASFVKVTQSVFFGQLPKELENVKEVPFGMRFAMGILAVLCVVTGLFPEMVNTYLTEPAARAILNVGDYIRSMGFMSDRILQRADFAHAGVWAPVSWLLILCIALLAVTIVAVAAKYDAVSISSRKNTEAKYQLFYGGEDAVFSQVGGGDLFWGFKHNWRHYFDFMHRLHSGVVNDYALWAVVALALAIGFAAIVL
jgi:multicomponent Na+:H+ antiporter subunit D